MREFDCLISYRYYQQKTHISKGLRVDLQVKSAVNIEGVLQFGRMDTCDDQRALSSFFDDAKLVFAELE